MHAPCVYLDNHATTAVDPRVVDRMLPYFGAVYGNASSRTHCFGWEADEAVEQAREHVASLMHASPREVIFTSGATECNNLALKGIGRGSHIITMATEHHSVLHPIRSSPHTVLAPRQDGILDLEALEHAIEPRTALVSVMYANNETGVLQSISAIGALCRRKGVLFHCDAAQAFGKVPIDVDAQCIDLLSVSAHKIYGPKGIGALYIRRSAQKHLAPLIEGGGQEFGIRPGTPNVPAIVGFGEASAIAARESLEENCRIATLRDHLLQRLQSELAGVAVNGSLTHRLAGNLNVSFESVPSHSLLRSLPDVAISTGSACSSGTVEPSHVLQAMGLPLDRVHNSVRACIGRFTTQDEIDYAATRIIQTVQTLRRNPNC